MENRTKNDFTDVKDRSAISKEEDGTPALDTDPYSCMNKLKTKDADILAPGN